MSETAIDDGEPGSLETDAVHVRTLEAADLEAVVAIDAAAGGRQRSEYFRGLVQRAVANSDVRIALVAEMEGRVVGFVTGCVFYGEFGLAEPSATIDAIGVDPEWRRRKVGEALLRQLRLNLGALRVSTLRTEVSWNDFDLLAFLRSQDFAPSDRLCLERRVDPTAPED